MKLFGIYVLFILLITILLPIALTQRCDPVKNEIKIEKIDEKKIIQIYNTKTSKVEDIELEEYIKGVVAAEMPAGFHIEALKAQAVAARTYAIYRLEKYKDGHPEHPKTALCNGIHCQAWYSKDELREVKPENWMYEYWPKIEEAVEATKGEIITHNGKTIEPLFHSTSGGMTENSEDYFVSAVAYLRSVPSPYEEGAPKLNEKVKMSIDNFINKLEGKYSNVSLTKDTIPNKIQLVEKSESGRIMKLRIDNEIVTGRDIRSLFNLNSTNFKISIYPKNNTIEFDTVGYGHGVGMSQWGANGMGQNGSIYIEILKHYYLGVEIIKAY